MHLSYFTIRHQTWLTSVHYISWPLVGLSHCLHSCSPVNVRLKFVLLRCQGDFICRKKGAVRSANKLITGRSSVIKKFQTLGVASQDYPLMDSWLNKICCNATFHILAVCSCKLQLCACVQFNPSTRRRQATIPLHRGGKHKDFGTQHRRGSNQYPFVGGKIWQFSSIMVQLKRIRTLHFLCLVPFMYKTSLKHVKSNVKPLLLNFYVYY